MEGEKVQFQIEIRNVSQFDIDEIYLKVFATQNNLENEIYKEDVMFKLSKSFLGGKETVT